ncbi:MAG: tripartite tricarboxylate transporter substrate binding protein [Burkholderiales bacterium]|nr:tripartite tricarboxylate transporter substrate binding protein [Burkholderiales bacterium]
MSTIQTPYHSRATSVGRPRYTAALAALCVCGAAGAQTYPSKPIRFIVASQPGGLADTVPRLLGPRLQENLGAPIVIENRPAGGIVTGAEAVARAAPDGYTLLSATPQVAIVQSMVKDLAFDPRRDLAPVSLVGVVPNLLIVAPGMPARTLRDLIAYARANPGRLNYSSTGAGTSVHLSAELFKHYAGVDIVHVPYKGAAAATTALIAGTVDLSVETLSSAMPHIRAGKVRVLATFARERLPQLPEVPTLFESGYKELEINGWAGVVTTGKTPARIVARLDSEIGKALAHEPTAALYDKAGLTVRYQNAAGFGRFWDEEIQRFALAIKVSGAQKN